MWSVCGKPKQNKVRSLTKIGFHIHNKRVMNGLWTELYFFWKFILSLLRNKIIFILLIHAVFRLFLLIVIFG